MAELSVQQKNLIKQYKNANPKLKNLTDKQILSIMLKKGAITLTEAQKKSIFANNNQAQSTSGGLEKGKRKQTITLKSGRKIEIKGDVVKYYAADGTEINKAYFEKQEGQISIKASGRYSVTKAGKTSYYAANGTEIKENYFKRVESSDVQVKSADGKSYNVNKALEGRLNNVSANLKKAEESNGFIGKSWSWVKNTLDFGDSSNKVRELIETEKKLLAQFNSNEQTRPKVFQKLTGVEYTQENLEKFLKGEIKLKSEQALAGYNEGQEMAVDIAGDIISGIAAVGIYTAAVAAAPFSGGASILVGVAAAGASGALIKSGIKSLDAVTGGREYTADNFKKDLATGAFSGVLAPITGGMGGAVGKTVATRFGIQAVKQVGKEVAEEAVTQTTKGFVKTALTNPYGYEYIGGNAFKRGLAYSAEMVTDGTLGGSIDGAFRTAYDGGSLEEIGESALIGGVSGGAGAWFLGGVIKGLGKGAQKIFGKNNVEIDANGNRVRVNDDGTVVRIDENGNEIPASATDAEIPFGENGDNIVFNYNKKSKTTKKGINYVEEESINGKIIQKNLPKSKFKTIDEFKEYLSCFKGNGDYLRYSEEDVSSLINMYKENPNLIEYLALIEDSSMARSYNVYQIEKLFNLHKTNPETVEHFILDRNFNGYVYTANDINIYIEATLKNKKLAEELISRKGYYTTSQIKEIVDNIDSNPKILEMINAKTIDKEGNQIFAYDGNTIVDFINGKELKPRQAFLMSIDDNSGNKLLSDQEISELLIQSDGSQRANILIDFCMEHKEYSSILKLFASYVKDRKCYKSDLFYTTDSSGNQVVNRKMCDHLLELIGKDSGYYSISTPYLENVYELNVVNPHGGKNIRFELSDSGVPIKLEQEKITNIGKNKKVVEHIFENGTSIRQEIDYCNYREYSGTETLIGSAHKKEFYDKMGKLLYSEEIIPSSTRSGEYNIVVTRNGKKEIVGCVKQYGSNSQGTRIGRKLVSADGTVTKQVKIEGPKGGGSRYIITDSQGNVKFSLKRQHHKINDNHYTSRVNNDRYDIQFFEDRIEVKRFDINGKCTKTVELSSEELDFEALELYKKLPGDYFIKLKEMGVKVKKFPHCKEIDQCGGAYCSWEDKLIAFAELDSFVFAHELGHALDMLYLNGLCKDKHLLNIFRQELARYKLNSSATEGHFIDYFTTLKHYSDEGCIIEVIAETNALLSGLSNTASTSTMLGLRSITLQQHFPETIAYIAQKLI